MKSIPYYSLLICLCLMACGKQTEQKTVIRERESSEVVTVVEQEWGIEDWKKITPEADGFDFPVGPPDGKGYYNAQKFGRNLHLGDDWNGTGGGNSDLGDPVYAAARGVVIYAEDHGAGWGNIVRLLHKTQGREEDGFVETLYAHLDTIMVSQGDTLERGTQLGTIGNADGAYYAHLHLELRTRAGMPVGGGYAEDQEGYTDPTAFIKKNRPAIR